jgi:putative zinc finger/helix-turn-helix YgiT family protein
MRGLPGIILHDITVLSCPRCGHSELAVSAIEELRHAIARAIIAKRQRLMPREIRFLRRQLELSGIELATHLGATPESVSRWEHGRTPMGVTADRLLRLMVVVAQGTAYSLKALRVVARHEPRPTPIHVRWHDGGWEAVTGLPT